MIWFKRAFYTGKEISRKGSFKTKNCYTMISDASSRYFKSWLMPMCFFLMGFTEKYFTCKVSVIWRHNCVFLALLHSISSTSIPLANAGSTCISKYDTSNSCQCLSLTVSFDGCSDLLRSRGDSEVCFTLDSFGQGLIGNAGRSEKKHVSFDITK